MLMSKEREAEKALPERWSARGKSEVVLRLFRGESVDDVSREIQVSVHEIETWRKDFLESSTSPARPSLRAHSRERGEVTVSMMSLILDDLGEKCA